MMNIAINGFGRIGRAAFKLLWGKKDVNIVAVNDLGDVENMAYLLKYDSVYGKWAKDVVAGKETLIIVSLNPDLIEERKRKAIEAELIDLFGASLPEHLVEADIKLLKFVNGKNTMNLVVSYKDISKLLNITKPTTRAKLSHLISLGLLQVEKRGRTKALKITAKGRRLVR